MRAYRGMEVYLYTILTSALDGGNWKIPQGQNLLNRAVGVKTSNAMRD
jgi:hypothetical protein